MEPFYRTSFSKHLHSLAISDFYSRYIDADDLEFLEYVKARGSANGNLPNTGVVLLEEMEFWHLPYSVAPNVRRHFGRRPRTGTTAEQDALRQSQRNLWHAQRELRAKERAVADLELEREKKEWKAANERRKLTAFQADYEWEAADPKRTKIGATIGRHHVPQWKLDERRIIKEKADLIRAEQKKEQNRQLRERLAAEQEANNQNMDRIAQLLELEAKEKALEKARNDLEQAKKLQKQQTTEIILPRIKALLNEISRSHSNGWSINMVMRLTGCTDRALLEECLLEIDRERFLKAAATPKMGEIFAP